MTTAPRGTGLPLEELAGAGGHSPGSAGETEEPPAIPVHIGHGFRRRLHLWYRALPAAVGHCPLLQQLLLHARTLEGEPVEAKLEDLGPKRKALRGPSRVGTAAGPALRLLQAAHLDDFNPGPERSSPRCRHVCGSAHHASGCREAENSAHHSRGSFRAAKVSPPQYTGPLPEGLSAQVIPHPTAVLSAPEGQPG
ncbi:hypothetical protein TREES_T100018756 [Tupaia chinensis]|uniref:Uncharacterized protein n=1 Tax=Tupaia chinensis TaxID=246437 RepID=L9KIA0_TUPCH|nr:hypothetical protein TREES_T100018756 [Tupaia chinensis]